MQPVEPHRTLDPGTRRVEDANPRKSAGFRFLTTQRQAEKVMYRLITYRCAKKPKMINLKLKMIKRGALNRSIEKAPQIEVIEFEM